MYGILSGQKKSGRNNDVTVLINKVWSPYSPRKVGFHCTEFYFTLLLINFDYHDYTSKTLF